VSKSYRKIIRNRKRRIERRLEPEKAWSDQPEPMMTGSNIHYEMSEKTQAINCGGIGAIHTMVNKIGLRQQIDKRLHLLKRHLPYHESDHVLSLAYNAMLDGVRLQDIELRRNDEAFLDGLGAQRIPDPTTSGDFTRRFASRHRGFDGCHQCHTAAGVEKQGADFLSEAFIDVDGTTAATTGECKGGMSLSYKGIWGYAPLVVSLANTNEVLYLVNRPGNVTSHEGCVQWIDRAIGVVAPHAGKITLRGDTDFTLSGELDRWHGPGIILFSAWTRTEGGRTGRTPCPKKFGSRWSGCRATRSPPARRKPGKVKEEVVRAKGYKNQSLQGESVAEIEYRPHKCKQSYRLMIVRKNISVQKGENVLFDEIRYFFYITNRRADTAEKIVGLANGRCNQENVIEQLKNGVNAMRMPVDDLLSNWAYMVMTALAWNLKAWFGCCLPASQRGEEILNMEFRRFLHSLILIPAQIVRAGRRIIYRLLSYNSWVPDLFRAWEALRRLQRA
jgi:hypothetical protein